MKLLICIFALCFGILPVLNLRLQSLRFSRFLSKVSGRPCIAEGTNLHRDDAAWLVVIWLGRVIAIQWIKLWVGFIVEVVNPQRGEVKMEAIHQEQNFDLCPPSL